MENVLRVILSTTWWHPAMGMNQGEQCSKRGSSEITEMGGKWQSQNLGENDNSKGTNNKQQISKPKLKPKPKQKIPELNFRKVNSVKSDYMRK